MNSTPEIFSLLQVSSTGIWRGFPTTTINSTDRIVINNNNNNNSNNNHGSNYNNFNNGNSYIKGWNKNFNKYRRPSSSSYTGKSPLSRYNMSYNHNNNSSINGYARRGSTTTVQHSPGAYIPPNARTIT